MFILDTALDSLFKQMKKTTDSNSTGGGTVFACERHKHVPVLHVRQARYVYILQICFQLNSIILYILHYVYEWNVTMGTFPINLSSNWNFKFILVTPPFLFTSP